MIHHGSLILDLDHFLQELLAVAPGARLLDMGDADMNIALPPGSDVRELDKLVARTLFADPRFRSDMGPYWLLVLTPLDVPREPASLLVSPVGERSWAYFKIDPHLSTTDVRHAVDMGPFLRKELHRHLGRPATPEEVRAVQVEDLGDITFFSFKGQRFMAADHSDPARFQYESWPPLSSTMSLN